MAVIERCRRGSPQRVLLCHVMLRADVFWEPSNPNSATASRDVGMNGARSGRAGWVGRDGHDGPMFAIRAARMKAGRNRWVPLCRRPCQTAGSRCTGSCGPCCGRRPRRRRVWRSSANASGASAGHAPPTFFPRGRCVAPLPVRAARLRCRAQRGNARARTARDFVPVGQRRGLAHQPAPPVLTRAVFRRSCSIRRDDGLPQDRPTRSSAAAGARTDPSERRPPPSGCLRRAPAPLRRHRADGRSSPVGRPVPKRRAEAVRPSPAGARRTEQHHAAHADAASTRPWPRRSRRCGLRDRRRRPSGWRRGRRDGRGGPGVDGTGGSVWELACGRHGWRSRSGRPPAVELAWPPTRSHGPSSQRGRAAIGSCRSVDRDRRR